MAVAKIKDRLRATVCDKRWEGDKGFKEMLRQSDHNVKRAERRGDREIETE